MATALYDSSIDNFDLEDTFVQDAKEDVVPTGAVGVSVVQQMRLRDFQYFLDYNYDYLSLTEV